MYTTVLETCEFSEQNFQSVPERMNFYSKGKSVQMKPGTFKYKYYIPSSEIQEFPSVMNFDTIASDDINFHFHFLP